VILQAGLLAVSLAALMYDRDVTPPWMAIFLAVGGIVLLAATVEVEARFRSKSELESEGWRVVYRERKRPGEPSD
jgi:hypothetical protein